MTRVAMELAKCVQELVTEMNAKLTGGQGIFGHNGLAIAIGGTFSEKRTRAMVLPS
jgi:hypothetical protein